MSYLELINTLKNEFPNIVFKTDDHFSWNNNQKTITYINPDSAYNNQQDNKLANKLLHELAHAKLNHSDYKSDAELLKIESSAWDLAKDLSQKYNIEFDNKEQEESLASYISWASSRSKCPKCKKNGLQTASTKFLCPNCSHKWNVGKSRFTRTYRH